MEQSVLLIFSLSFFLWERCCPSNSSTFSISFLVSVRIMSFSSLRNLSARTNIAAPSDFNFTLRGIDVIGFAQEVQDLRIALIPASRVFVRTSLFQSFFVQERNVSNNNKKNSTSYFTFFLFFFLILSLSESLILNLHNNFM